MGWIREDGTAAHSSDLRSLGIKGRKIVVSAQRHIVQTNKKGEEVMTHRPVGSLAKRISLESSIVRRKSWGLLIIAVIVTLLAYQSEHHGLWGRLVNYSKTPQISLIGTRIRPRDLSLSLYRTGGPAMYGDFVVQVTLEGVGGHHSWEVWGPKALASLPRSQIIVQDVSGIHWTSVVPVP